MHARLTKRNPLPHTITPSGRASVSKPVRHGFEPRSSHSKDFKNGTHCLLVWRSMYKNGVGKVKHMELPVDQPPAVAFTQTRGLGL